MVNEKQIAQDIRAYAQRYGRITYGASDFLLESGGIYSTMLDPLQYISEHGAYTPSGQKITSFIFPQDSIINPLAVSVYEYIEKCTRAGAVTV